MTTDHTGRFPMRVADYVKYRPGYPPAVLRLPEGECGLDAASAVADSSTAASDRGPLLLAF